MSSSGTTASLGGKAVNLFELQSVAGVRVPPFIVLPAHLSDSDCRERVERFLSAHSHSHVAVRSSAAQEDSSKASFAGIYATVLDVPAEITQICSAIEEVRASGTSKQDVASHYAKERGITTEAPAIAVVVQEMLSPESSGVIFSHGLSARDGYYVISMSKGSGDSVVSGQTNGELIRVVRSVDSRQIDDSRIAQLVNTMRAIEAHYGNDSLDVEFAFSGNELYVLQCRPITTSPEATVNAEDEQELARQLTDLESMINEQYANDVLGDMIDINPLELLGQCPSALDISIFKHLFADSIVEHVRRGMGYDPLHVGLIRVIGGKPYVSLRASAFSFRPRGISAETYERMFGVYREQLALKSCLQSSVEFNVFAMGCGPRLDEVMRSANLTETEQEDVRRAFGALDDAFIGASSDCVETLEEWASRYAVQTNLLSEAPIGEVLDHVTKGTEQFVRVARLAFYWKNRFEERFPGDNLDELITGHIRSVSTRMQNDLAACRDGSLTRADLVERYGHLRPGQFSMFGESYEDAPDHYLFSRLLSASNNTIPEKRHGYENTPEFKNVVAFMQAREETKFLFSRALHTFIKRLKVMLMEAGISPQSAAKRMWSELPMLLKVGDPTPSSQRPCAELPMYLPEVIVPGNTCMTVVVLGEAAATYVTRASIRAPIQVLNHPDDQVDVRGKIVLIPYADPGYDFLFHSGIAGIISKVGGPASHMCVRAIELQVPACIGCGERLYASLAASETVLLDCESRQVIALS